VRQRKGCWCAASGHGSGRQPQGVRLMGVLMQASSCSSGFAVTPCSALQQTRPVAAQWGCWRTCTPPPFWHLHRLMTTVLTASWFSAYLC